MRKSDSTAQLAAALAKAQAVMKGAVKDSLNPHFKSHFADLASVWEACRGPLTAHGLSVAQFPQAEGGRVTVTTLLLHASGEFLEGDLTATARDEGPQGIGSVITYLRRYALAAMAGVAPEDDDAEHAEGRTTGASATPPDTVVDVRSGEQVPRSARPKPPAGYHYIGSYKLRNGWHELDLLDYDAKGGSIRLSTKQDIGFTAEQAFAAGIPVRVKVGVKKGAVGEGYLNAIETYKTEPEPHANDDPPLTDADIPFEMVR